MKLISRIIGTKCGNIFCALRVCLFESLPDCLRKGSFICVNVCRFVCSPDCVPLCISVCMSAFLSVCVMFFHMCHCLSIFLPDSLSANLIVCLSA